MDNSTPEMSQQLVQYLDGDLTVIEKQQLEQELAVNTELRDALQSLQATREAVRLYGLQQRVSGIHQQMMEEFKAPVQQISRTRKWMRYAVAVAASVVILVAGYMAYNFFSLTPEKVFAANFQSYELVTTRDGAAEESALLKLYREKNFEGVIGVSDNRPFTTEELFARGMAFAELRKNDSAIVLFKEVIAANKTAAQPVYNDEAEYYLALEYIRNGEFDKALLILNKISDTPGHLYHEKATSTLIRKVKRLQVR